MQQQPGATAAMHAAATAAAAAQHAQGIHGGGAQHLQQQQPMPSRRPQSQAIPATDAATAAQLAARAQDKDKYVEQFDFPYCAKVDKYEKLTKIGQGTFGEVFKARLRTEKTKIVALKKVLMDNEKEGFPITALREIRILQLLNHDNIVNLIEICRQYSRHSKTTFYLVFDFAEHDLAGLLSNVNVKFSLGEIKKVMQQMFEGLFYIHSNKIIHRDMKAANVRKHKLYISLWPEWRLVRNWGGIYQAEGFELAEV
jgi:serine/threonine protein kinase